MSRLVKITEQENCASPLGQPGQIVTLTVTGYTHKGWGVARLGRQVIFIPGALRDEQIQAEIVAAGRGFWQARLLRLLKPSPERREPLCPVYAGCGGCNLQHMSYKEELAFKQEQVQAALRRIGGLKAELRPIIGAAPQQLYHYRNKGIFHVSREQGGCRLVFWEENSHQPAGTACSLLFPPAMDNLLRRLQQQELPPAVTDVLLRYSQARQKLLLFLFMAADSGPTAVQQARSFLQQLSREMPELAVYGLRQGDKWQTLSEEKYLVEQLGELEYQIAPEAFFQVNNAQTLRLLQVMQAALSPQTHVLLDAYCGIGTLGLWLARQLPRVQRLLGVEVNAGAVASARQNAQNNQLTAADFYLGKAEAEFPKLLARHRHIDAVIVDPPRRGCHKQLLAGLLKLAPAQLLYVSCNPATLARDLQLLCADGRFILQFAQPVDMFPRTHHVETVCLLSKG